MVVLMNNETEQQQRREENGNVDGPKKSDLWNFQPAQIERTSFTFRFGSQSQNLATVQKCAQSKIHPEKIRK